MKKSKEIIILNIRKAAPFSGDREAVTGTVHTVGLLDAGCIFLQKAFMFYVFIVSF